MTSLFWGILGLEASPPTLCPCLLAGALALLPVLRFSFILRLIASRSSSALAWIWWFWRKLHRQLHWWGMDCNGYDKYLLGAQNLDMVLIVTVLWELHCECHFSHFLHMPHSFLQFYTYAQDIYVRVNISNMEMCSSSDSPQIDAAMSLPFPSPWPLRWPSAALHGSSVHTNMWLKMVLLWVCDCTFYFWRPLKCWPQSWELLRRPQLGSPASCWMRRAQHSSPGSCSRRSLLLGNPVELPIIQCWAIESILCYI